MATLVAFHAHPDDEAIGTGGTLAKAATEGHRVVLVVATRGERGEVPPGSLAPHETLAERRSAETEAAATVLGIARVEFLGYRDSGMGGDPANGLDSSFWRADVDEAAERLARILDDEVADVLTVYDENGGYGHPDHVQVHRVGVRAAELVGTPRVFEAVMNRDHIVRLLDAAADMGLDLPDLPEPATLDGFGVPECLITTAVDVSDFLEIKRRAMAAHASQITDTSLFLSLPPDAFAATWGTEWFIRRGVPVGRLETSLFSS